MHDCAKFCFFQQRPPVHRQPGWWQRRGPGFQEASPEEGCRGHSGGEPAGCPPAPPTPPCLRELEVSAVERMSFFKERKKEKVDGGCGGWGRKEGRERKRKKEREREREKENGKERGRREGERRKTGRQRRKGRREEEWKEEGRQGGGREGGGIMIFNPKFNHYGS